MSINRNILLYNNCVFYIIIIIMIDFDYNNSIYNDIYFDDYMIFYKVINYNNYLTANL